MQDNHKAFYLSLVLSIVETIKDNEKPKSARHNRIDNLIDSIVKAVDIYRPDSWSYDDMEKASRIHDKINKIIKKEFSEKETPSGRDAEGRQAA